MKYPSLVAGLGLAVLAVLASTTVALAKEGLRASLTTPIPSTAVPGDEIVLAWTLTYVDANIRNRPFIAENVFVKLLSSTRDATIGFATGGDHGRGEYVARVKVPSGGIAAIQFGTRGCLFGTTGNCAYNILPMESEVSLPAATSKPVSASANAATGVPALASLLGLICLAGLGAIGMAGRRRGHPSPPA